MSRSHLRARSSAVALAALALFSSSACGDDPEALTAPALSSLRLTAQGPALHDALGRRVLLRGVNAGGRSKLQPFFPFAFAESGHPGQEDAPAFADALSAYVDRPERWELSVVRLPFTWEAVEPSRGTYDELYLERYRTMAEAFSDRGIRVVVDFHQDVFAQPFCGDGFPLWAIAGTPPDKPEDCGDWFLGYWANPAVEAAFDRFWNDEDDLRTDFAATWRLVAAELWEVDGVIGFEIINEPAPGATDETTWAVEILTPFYAEMAAVIHEVAPEALVFFDATGLDGITAETEVERPEGERLVFAPHYYSGEAMLGLPDLSGVDHERPLGSWADYGVDWDLPVLVGEFGISNTHPQAADFIGRIFDALDSNALHGTQWEYSTCEDDWNGEGMSIVDLAGEETGGVEGLVRAFPRAVAGELISFSYDAADGSGTLVWEAQVDGVTEIAAPRELYVSGVEGLLDGVLGEVVDDGEGTLLIACEEAGAATLTFGPVGD